MASVVLLFMGTDDLPTDVQELQALVLQTQRELQVAQKQTVELTDTVNTGGSVMVTLEVIGQLLASVTVTV